jgi:lycopene cyclase domain-containing protein
MKEYPALAALSVLVVLALEFAWWRTGLLRRRVYWVTMAIVIAFMIPVDGWLTRLPDPVVGYRPDRVSGWRPVWDILAEEYLYAFSLLTAVLLLWERQDRSGTDTASAVDTPRSVEEVRA